MCVDRILDHFELTPFFGRRIAVEDADSVADDSRRADALVILAGAAMFVASSVLNVAEDVSPELYVES